jgi:sterol desaturase/sphingolipid hydroxylase (fatty acid hydroxylase superfamily)
MGSEALIRLAVFVAVLGILALAERWAPRRPWRVGRRPRWPGNLGLVALGVLLIRLASPLTVVGVAAFAETRGWGLLHAFPAVPAPLALALSIAALDLAIYLQHVLFHAVPALWRLHRVHHTDLDVDVTTGVRFHPVELYISVGFKSAAVVLAGASPVAVIVFEVLLNAGSLFGHANVRLPMVLDRVLRWVLVTPDMHRVHHSVHPIETGSNFGFTLSWWDRLLGTYRAQPADTHATMRVGVEGFGGPVALGLDRLLVQPFLSHPDPIGGAHGGDGTRRDTGAARTDDRHHGRAAGGLRP